MGWFEPEYMKTARMFYKNVERLAEPWSNDRIKKLRENKIKKVCIPISPDTIPTISVAAEAAKAIMNCLSDKFYNPHVSYCISSPYWGYSHLFYEMSVNYLAACIYFFAHNDVPHSDELYKVNYKFAHILFFLNLDFINQIEVLQTNNEVYPLIRPIKNLLENKDAFYLVTANFEIFFGKILSKENIWLMTEDEFRYYPSIDGDFDDYLNKIYTACQEDVTNFIRSIYRLPERNERNKPRRKFFLDNNENQAVAEKPDNSPSSEDEPAEEIPYEDILQAMFNNNQVRFDSLIETNNENELVKPDYKEMLPSEAFRVMMCQPSVVNDESPLIIRNLIFNNDK